MRLALPLGKANDLTVILALPLCEGRAWSQPPDSASHRGQVRADDGTVIGRLAWSQVRFGSARALVLIAGPVTDQASSHLSRGWE